VPASFAPTGYTALFVLEAPEVRFDDVIEAKVWQAGEPAVQIDPRFLEVCEPGSIRVCGTSCDWPVTIGVRVTGAAVRLRFQRKANRYVNVVIRLTGIRKGFSGLRLPDRTRAEFESNERFINSAYER
jgi:hypothetical protein